MVDNWFYDDYPGGSLQQFPQRLAHRRSITKVVGHTTEGSNWPGYAGGVQAPHATIDPWNKKFRQHFGLDVAGWALKAPSYVSTNTAGVIQFEIIGTCNPSSPLAATKFFPTAPDHVMEYAAGLIRMVSDRLGVPWQSSVQMVAYPASYGLNAPQRLSAAQWLSYSGFLCHEHVPGNSHGDAGALDVVRFMRLGGGGTTPAPTPTPTPEPGDLLEEEEDMKDHIIACYRQIALFDPNEADLNWCQVASANQRTRQDVVNWFWVQPCDRRTVDALYQKFLGRSPGESEYGTWQAVSNRTAWDGISNSPEAIGRR